MNEDKDFLISALKESNEILQEDNSRLRNTNRILRNVNSGLRTQLARAAANDEAFKDELSAEAELSLFDVLELLETPALSNELAKAGYRIDFKQIYEDITDANAPVVDYHC